jgi:RNA polymerase sigma-70 factor (ECF subfamily)
MADAENAELLERWRGGDAGAGRAVFERHFDSVFRFFASKLGDIAAQDLTQRTFVALVESRDRVRDGARLRAYVLSIARHQLLMFLRSRGRRGVEVELAHSCAEDLMPSPPSALARNEQERLLVQALRRIPLESQMLLELHYWEELSTEEIAGCLGVPRGTVKSRLFRAREEVRQALVRVTDDVALRASSVQDLEAWLARLRTARAPIEPGARGE